MSLLSTAKAESQVKVEEVVEAASTDAPVAKKHSNSEYQKKARAKALASAQLIKKELEAKKVELSAEGKEALAFLCKEGRAVSGGNFGTPVLYKLFGNTPKKGDKITALKVFEDTGKGFAEMRKLMKQWEEKQKVSVTYDEKTKSYVINSDVPAYNA